MLFPIITLYSPMRDQAMKLPFLIAATCQALAFHAAAQAPNSAWFYPSASGNLLCQLDIPWTAGSIDLYFDRVITRIDGIWITVADSHCLDPVSIITGERRYSFKNHDGDLILF
jgi:hypothetical protein